MNNNITPDKKPYKKLPPFKGWVLQNFPFIEADFDALTNYQMMCKIIEYLKVFQNNLDNMSDNENSLYNAFIELQNYVNNYFDNLDVQEEINNKLDAMVEDGTMERLIGNYLDENIDIIFPKRWSESYSTMGDITLIKYKDKNIVIDTGLEDRWGDIRAMLLTNNVSHIDVLVITHWHIDHYSNLENLLTYNYIDSTTKFFCPGDVTLWDDIVSVQNEYKAWFESNNLEYYIPNENETYTIDLLDIKFNNTSDLDAYYNMSSAHDYNQCSMVITMNFKNNRFLFMADGGADTETRMLKDFDISQKVDLYKIGHHSINQTSNYDFIRNVCPTFAVAIASPTDFSTSKLAINMGIEIMRNNGSQIYATFNQDDYLHFNSNGSCVKVVNAIPLAYSHSEITRDIYVDITADKDSYQDGSSTAPYRELLQAIGTINYDTDLIVNIHLADGIYCKSISGDGEQKVKTLISGTKRTIVNILGNSSDRTAVKIQCCNFINANVNLKDLTIDATNNRFDPVYCENSRVTLNNVYIGTESRVPYHLINSKNSTLYILNSTFYNCARCITLEDNSYATIRSCTFDTVTTAFINSSNSDYSTQAITITNSDIKFLAYRRKINSPIQIYTGSGESETTSIPISSFDWIEVYYRTDDYVYGNTGRIYSPASRSVEVNVPHLSADNGTIYNKQAKISFTNTGFEVSKRINETIVVSSGNTTYTTPDHNIYVSKVVGGFNDFQS